MACGRRGGVFETTGGRDQECTRARAAAAELGLSPGALLDMASLFFCVWLAGILYKVKR